MRAWLRQHRHAAALALSRVARASGLAGALVIGVALALPAVGYALLGSLASATSRLALEPQISLFLRPEAKRAEAEALGAALRSHPRIARVRFVPREQALRELESVDGISDLVAALGHNPLPDAFVVSAKGAPLETLATELGKLPGVERVQADMLWAQRLAALTGVARVAVSLLALLLAAGLVAVTFNTIRLQIVTQRAEIEVAKLLGATDGFVRRPFYYLGLLQGAAGGVAALGIVAIVLALLDREVQPLAASYGSAFRFAFLASADAAAVVALAGFLGWLGAGISVRRHLREIESA